MTINRRSVMMGIGAGAVLASGRGATAAAVGGDRLFASTPFAANRVAAKFERVDLALPAVAVQTDRGTALLPRLVRSPRLVTLWAEWCVPCLIEARDLAAMRASVRGARFDILSVLTGSGARLDHAGAVARLAKVGAAGLPVAVEPAGGHAIAAVLASEPSRVRAPVALPPGARPLPGGGFSLPCTLLVDARGRVRGRALGIGTVMKTAAPSTPGGAPHTLSDAEKQAMMENGTTTTWATADGRAFLQALGGGLLDRV